MSSNKANRRRNSNNHELFSVNQKAAIKGLPVPNEVTFLAASTFDTKSIVTDGNVWRFRYSGNNVAVFFNKFICPHKKHLMKFCASQYVIDKLPTKLDSIVNCIGEVFGFLEEKKLTFSKENLVNLLEFGQWKEFRYREESFYIIVFFIRALSKYDFPLIGENVEDDLVPILRPKRDSFLIYQELDNVISNESLTLILNGLWNMSKSFDEGTIYETSHLMDASILGLEYVTGARPVQLDKLMVCDFSVDTLVKTGGFGYYSIAIPYAKTGVLSSDLERIKISLPYEVANLIRAYIKQKKLCPKDKLFPTWASSSEGFNNAINRQVFRFSPKNYQALVSEGKIALMLFTSSEFRHNVGHSLAMQGATAAEIAFVLGHSSEVVARHYILATPELARVRFRALGINAAWQNMMALMITGDLLDEDEWDGIKVAGIIGGQLVTNCGGCGRISKECPFSEIRACYGCLYFRPFTKGEHELVLLGVQKEITEAVELSNAVGNARNPAVEILTQMKESIMLVMKRVVIHDINLNHYPDKSPASFFFEKKGKYYE